MNLTELPALLWDGMVHTLHTATHPQTVARADADQLANTGSHTWLALLGLIGAVLGGALVAATRKANRR